MKKNLIEVYALAVCFASMFFVVVAGAICLFEFLRIVEPSVTISSYYHERSLSNEQFLQTWPQNRPVPEPATVARLRTEEFDRTLRSERHDGFRSFLQSLMFTIAAGLVFWLHWRLEQQERASTFASAA